MSPGFYRFVPRGIFYMKVRKSMTEYISIDDVMSVFDDYMRGDVNGDDRDTFFEMLKDKAESEDKDVT